jgi:hypothetical protein
VTDEKRLCDLLEHKIPLPNVVAEVFLHEVNTSRLKAY